MNQNITAAAGSLIAPRVLSAIRLRWVVYGAAAYFALRFMNKRGILPKQTGAALDAIDNGFMALKERAGFGAIEQPTLH